jgi:polyisoprenoid-binding protein YceI
MVHSFGVIKFTTMTESKQTNWTIDRNHSEVQFKVKHLAISNVSGTFKLFTGNVQVENDDFNNALIHFEIDTNSIDTNNTERDNHLKSPVFFDTENFPKILFDGNLKETDGDFTLEGQLTILKTTKKVKLEAQLTGVGTGRFGDTRAGFEINGKINRRDFGLNFGLLTEAGSLVVGDDVKLHFDIQLIGEAVPAPQVIATSV